MERREPDFEDERIRQWRVRPEELPLERDDPTVMDVDLTHEEVFESRIYQIRPELLTNLALEVLLDRRDIPIEALAGLLVEGAEDAAFRLMAKRNKEDGLLTFIVVGVIAGQRSLLTREDGVEEQRFREFVQSFEEDAFSRGLAFEPTVVTLDQWQAYGRGRESGDSP